jgi:hypothetical protein
VVVAGFVPFIAVGGGVLCLSRGRGACVGAWWLYINAGELAPLDAASISG